MLGLNGAVRGDGVEASANAFLSALDTASAIKIITSWLTTLKNLQADCLPPDNLNRAATMKLMAG